MSDRTTRIDWAIFAVLGLFWGSSYLFIKIGVETLSPFTLVAGRLAVGATLLAVVLAVSNQRLPRNRRTYGHLGVMAALNIVIPFSLITWGERSIDSALASILNASVPLFTIILAAAFLADEPITFNRVIGLLVGFGGVVVLTSPSLSVGGGSLTGELAMIGSSIAYASGNVYARRYVRGLHPMVTSFFQVFFALIATAALALGFERPLAVSVHPSTIVSVLWLGIFGSGLAYLAFFRLHSRWGSTRSSLVAYLLPIVGIALGFLVLHERIDVLVLAGTTLIIGGVALVNSRVGQWTQAGRAAAGVKTRPG